MKMIHHPGGENRFDDAANEYDGIIGIELRGSSSQSYPQKPYAVETRNADGSNLNVSLLGLPAENDWVLLSNYNDKSLMRNLLGFKMFEELGHYAPRAKYVEVFLNGDYQGIYLFGEKIKRDNNRVNIATLKETDIDGEELTGGYIFKIDYWNDYDSWLSPYSPLDHPTFKVHFVYHDPGWDELVYQQKNYIKNYVSTFESTLYSSSYADPSSGYAAYLEVESFIDYFIVSEISRNNDGFKKSRYFHKDKNGKLVAGPVWDFDWAWKNINECFIFKATDGSGWSYKINDCNPWVKSPGWMVRLFSDDNFKNQTNCRYLEARAGVLSDEKLYATIDSLYNEVKVAQVRHFQKWNILGINVGAPEVDAQPTTYDGEVAKLRKWIRTRLNWLDAHMPGTCQPTDAEIISEEKNIQIYPNPASNIINVLSTRYLVNVQLFDISGKAIFSHSGGDKTTFQINVSGYKAGMYILRLTDTDGNIRNEKIIIR
ncbi:CotH kinase family protein [Maribellus sp. YY47]|uniref:CotH kinase family protein n=1 Tax=Maribellus sp. YY47 TaxID=2929486 RepID=UPI002001C1FE|nr:CotH kinase family protein [Maribellus sp. YY47]MCK3685427.1 CotH kinase family protein [Maribellus sp. YY47]